MTHRSRRLTVLLGVLVFGSAAPAHAADPAASWSQELRSQIPDDWQLRVRWRESALVAFVMPPTTQAFDLFYHSDDAGRTYGALCPKPGSPVWAALGEGQTLAVEPQVLGKGTLRLNCPRPSPNT